MYDVMERVRLVLLVDAELREALRVESSMSGRDMSDIIQDLLRSSLADTLELIRRRREADGKKKGRSP